jgi:plastocyanin
MRAWIVAAAIFFTAALTAAVATASTSSSHSHRTSGTHSAGRPHCARAHRCPARRPRRKRSKRHHHTANPMPGMVMPGGSMPAGSSMPPTAAGSSSSQPVPSSSGSSGSSSTGTTQGGTATPARLQVTAREFFLTLSKPSVPAGPVMIELVDLGQDAHNIHIQPAVGGADVAVFPTVQPGAHYDQQVTLAAGTYTVYCSRPYHEEMGMMVTLTVS